jgi:hypothetical protein
MKAQIRLENGKVFVDLDPESESDNIQIGHLERLPSKLTVLSERMSYLNSKRYTLQLEVCPDVDPLEFFAERKLFKLVPFS